MTLRNYVMLAVVFNCLTCSTFADVTERLRQQKRHSEEVNEHTTSRRQADPQPACQARSIEADDMMAEKAHTGVAATRWTMRRCDGR